MNPRAATRQIEEEMQLAAEEAKECREAEIDALGVSTEDSENHV
jgi:hypothetical protein